ncbi:NHLP bacteriocin system secretion protein [Leptolyngbya sp. 7M]|uniref:NHLP bacteriocin system secretion protein n=1 Tax=Leptolyngbya sp. 7M TaxID=2812896 RepID=UPI001B8B7613|nr:NHLP bacteriocin system secretion protein [Leptolyngbya sp. 7M]QYO64248.1 NHLP bacteriocin system secretion protein [Leptolyngbya sp. 7M]
MQGQQRRTFRQKSLERLSSPEQLDQLMQVTSPKSWLILSCMGCLVGAALLWSIVGRLPVTVTGRGVLIRPGRVVNLQAPGTGELISLDVQVGDYVRKGQMLGTIAQPELEKQLQQQRTKLAELQNQTENAKLLQSQRTRSELEAITQQRQNLQQRIEAATTFTTVLQSRGIESLQQRRQNLEQQLKQAQTLVPVLQNRLKRRQELLEAGALSGDALLDAQQVYLDSVRQVADLADQLKELDVREVETKKNYQENLTNIADLKTQLQALDSQERKLAEQNLEALTNRGNQIQEVKRTIAQLEVQLANNGQITSPYSGRIIELTATVGQLFSSSAIRLGSIEVEDQTSQLVALTYFPVRDGKQVQPKCYRCWQSLSND